MNAPNVPGVPLHSPVAKQRHPGAMGLSGQDPANGYDRVILKGYEGKGLVQ